MANYLPNGENCTVLYADVYFKPDDTARFRHLGICDSASWTPEVEIAEKTWKGEVVATQTTEKGATLNVVAGEMTWDNIKASFMASESDIIQEAGPISVTETDVMPGELVELGAYGVTGLTVTDGTDPLVDGVDYTYDASTDFLKVLTEQATLQIDGTKPEITAGERKILSVLAEDSGIKGEFRFVGSNTRGKKILLGGIRAELRPDGAVTVSSDSSDFQSLSFSGEVILNTASSQHPYGYAMLME
jgi:hypothetical protein